MIRAYRPGDETALVALFERAFGRPITPAHWLWKLKGLPAPAENVWLFEDEGEIIFHYAAIPVRYQLPAGTVSVMVSVDTMADPGRRRKGLLTQVGRFCYDFWREQGVAFVIGLPNEQWGSRAKALGWQPLFPLQWFYYPLRPEALLGQKLRLPFLARFAFLGRLWRRGWPGRPNPTLTIRPVTEAIPAFDQLWQACAPHIPISPIRDRQWLDWRYFRSPSFDYQLLVAWRGAVPAGYIAYRLAEQDGRKVGFIAELLTRPDDRQAQQALIAQSVLEMVPAGVESLVSLIMPGSWAALAFRSAGFLLPRHSFQVQIVPLSPHLSLPTLQQPANWHLMGGDFDVI